jgi:hypothetical protein
MRRFASCLSFNLVELSLAVAVVAVGVVSVFGILPHLLQSSRQAADYSALSLDIQPFMDDPNHRGMVTIPDLENAGFLPDVTSPSNTVVQSGSFIASRSISSYQATNADYTLTSTTNFYKNPGNRPLLKTVFITYRWGNTNNMTNQQSYTFITETACTEEILTP